MVIIFCVFAVWILVELILHIKKWAIFLQKKLIEQSKQKFGNSVGWEKPWRLTLLKIGIVIIFFGALATIYSTLFGPIIIGH